MYNEIEHTKFSLVYSFAFHHTTQILIFGKMSQSWNAHWVEDGFRPKRLGNWEVPRWHAQWPDMHCATTRFQAHSNGRLFTSVKRSDNPWSNFKGTWELPLKINRKTAEELSKDTEFKKAFWDAHKLKNEQICQRIQCQAKCKDKTVYKEQVVKIKSEKDQLDIDNKTEKKDAPSEKSINSGHKSKDECIMKEACLI